MDLKGRDFLKLLDFTTEEITYLVDLAAELKEKKKKGIVPSIQHSTPADNTTRPLHLHKHRQRRRQRPL